jgi:hypothetical protein
MVEHDPDGLNQLFTFRRAVLGANVVKFFGPIEELVAFAKNALRTHLAGEQQTSCRPVLCETRG